MEPRGGRCRHIDNPAFKGTHQLAVARVGGIGHDHVITGIHGQGCGQQQSGGPTGSHADAFGIDIQIMAFSIEIGDGLAQFGQSHGCGVGQGTAIVLFAHGIAYGRRRTEIRLPQTELDDTDTGCDHLVRFLAKYHGAEGIGLARATRHNRGHGLLHCFVFHGSVLSALGDKVFPWLYNRRGDRLPPQPKFKEE